MNRLSRTLVKAHSVALRFGIVLFMAFVLPQMLLAQTQYRISGTLTGSPLTTVHHIRLAGMTKHGCTVCHTSKHHKRLLQHCCTKWQVCSYACP